MDELLLHCDLFKVSAEVVRQRCAVLGPSMMRCILGSDFADCQAHTESVVRKVKAEHMDASYLSNTLFGGASGIAACLVVAIVSEEDHSDPDDAH